MSVRRPSTLRSLDRALRRVRADGRLDGSMGEAFATAARVSACEVDAACAPGSDVASYARGQVIAVHLRALKALDEHVTPSETDAWSRFLDAPEWRDYLAAADNPTAGLRAMADDPGEPEAPTARALVEWRPGDAFPLVEDDPGR